MRLGSAAAFAAAVLLSGCGGNPNEIKRFTPRALVLATMLDKAVKVHSTGEAAGVVREAERMYHAGQIDLTDYETIRRVEGSLRANERNVAVRVFETAMGRRSSAEETPEEKAAQKKTDDDLRAANEQAERKKNPSKGLDEVLGNEILPKPIGGK